MFAFTGTRELRSASFFAAFQAQVLQELIDPRLCGFGQNSALSALTHSTWLCVCVSWVPFSRLFQGTAEGQPLF